MSRGLGRVQRTILRTMQAAPDQAFTAKQLCGAVYRVTVKRNRRVVLRAGIQFAERAMVDSAMLYVRYLRNWRGRDRGLVFFNAANFASCRQAKEIVDSSAIASLRWHPIWKSSRQSVPVMPSALPTRGKTGSRHQRLYGLDACRSEIIPRPSGSTT